ncbi:hypothetical protein SADUNF_Sadunf06G0000500 [Salix dunnii]|uniref:Phosphoglycerate mutase family protein n=1 Tax=Salix dunnii TaxID=1413687 RepID=A0A835K081_9ROSI|nr:hypothetical protein SADUNF_Sadunf06G0000500 [Salix dunnii]
MNAKTTLTLTNITTSMKNPSVLTVKFYPCPCPSPPPPFPISSIRSSRCRPRTRSLPPSLVIQDTSTTTTAASDIDTDSLSFSRRLILLRHAKSSWDDRSLRDHDRPLSKSGELDAAKVSQKLQQLGWIPQLILSSDALRTKQTLKIMQQQVPDFMDAEVHFISSFYSIAAMDGQTADHLQQAICSYSRDDILTVMCMGHNRGWEEAASMLSGASIELNTCNAALLEAAGKSWAEVRLAPFLFVPLVFIRGIIAKDYPVQEINSGIMSLDRKDWGGGVKFENCCLPVAFASAGPGGWKLQAIVKPSDSPKL